MKALFGSQTLRLQTLLVAARTTRIGPSPAMLQLSSGPQRKITSEGAHLNRQTSMGSRAQQY